AVRIAAPTRGLAPRQPSRAASRAADIAVDSSSVNSASNGKPPEPSPGGRILRVQPSGRSDVCDGAVVCTEHSGRGQHAPPIQTLTVGLGIAPTQPPA